MNRNIGVLISGRGSNLQAIIDAIRDGRIDARVAIVFSNRADAHGLERARQAGIETVVRDHKAWPSREAYETVLVDDLRARDVGLVCLAGFMRLLGATFVSAFPNRILNIHPALLPSFPGLHAQRQAVEHGARISGATVHFVTTDLDAGPIILQASVPVLDARYRGDALRADPRSRAPHLPRGHSEDSRWPVGPLRPSRGQRVTQGRARHHRAEPGSHRTPCERAEHCRATSASKGPKSDWGDGVANVGRRSGAPGIRRRNPGDALVRRVERCAVRPGLGAAPAVHRR